MAKRPIDAEWTPKEKFWLRFAGSIAVAGVLALVLPAFGLQLRKLQKLGDNAWIVGIVLLIIAAISAGITFIRHYGHGANAARQAFQRFKWIALGGVASVVVLVVALVIFAKMRGSSTSRNWNEQAGVPPPDFRKGPPAPFSPPMPKGPPDLVTQYGEHRVVRIVLVGAEGLDVTAKIRAIAPQLADPGSGRSWHSSQHRGQPMVTIAPVADLEALVNRIDFGTVGEMDRENRTVTVTVDRTKFIELKSKPK